MLVYQSLAQNNRMETYRLVKALVTSAIRLLSIPKDKYSLSFSVAFQGALYNFNEL